jgi:hypothetical protein
VKSAFTLVRDYEIAVKNLEYTMLQLSKRVKEPGQYSENSAKTLADSLVEKAEAVKALVYEAIKS